MVTHNYFYTIFHCPSCLGQLHQQATTWFCENENLKFENLNGIPQFVLPHRKDVLEKFLSVYQIVRRNEGWGSENTEYYLSLPFRDTTGKHSAIWKIRERSFNTLLQSLTVLQEQSATILDVGAGNCWLSLQLSRRGYTVYAVDINTDLSDGLGVLSRLVLNGNQHIIPVKAEFDFLPFAQESFDAIIMNGSLHYSSNLQMTITNVMKFLRPDGTFFILDSPLYCNAKSGERMVKGRQNEFKEKYNLTLPDEFLGSYLTYQDLDDMKRHFVVSLHEPDYGLRWKIRQKVMPIILRREPASFAVIALQKQ